MELEIILLSVLIIFVFGLTAVGIMLIQTSLFKNSNGGKNRGFKKDNKRV